MCERCFTGARGRVEVEIFGFDRKGLSKVESIFRINSMEVEALEESGDRNGHFLPSEGATLKKRAMGGLERTQAEKRIRYKPVHRYRKAPKLSAGN